jgi:hypothetical protein
MHSVSEHSLKSGLRGWTVTFHRLVRVNVDVDVDVDVVEIPGFRGQ